MNTTIVIYANNSVSFRDTETDTALEISRPYTFEEISQIFSIPEKRRGNTMQDFPETFSRGGYKFKVWINAERTAKEKRERKREKIAEYNKFNYAWKRKVKLKERAV